MQFELYYNSNLFATINKPTCFISKSGTSIIHGYIDSTGTCTYIKTCEIDKAALQIESRSIVDSKHSIVPSGYGKPLFIKPDLFIKVCQKNALKILKHLVKIVSTQNQSKNAA